MLPYLVCSYWTLSQNLVGRIGWERGCPQYYIFRPDQEQYMNKEDRAQDQVPMNLDEYICCLQMKLVIEVESYNYMSMTTSALIPNHHIQPREGSSDPASKTTRN